MVYFCKKDEHRQGKRQATARRDGGNAVLNRVLSGDIKAALGAADDKFTWIQENLDDLPLKGDHRHRIPAQLFDLSIEHASSIQNLIGYASSPAPLP